MGLLDRFKKPVPPPSRRAYAPRKGLFTQCVCLLLDAPPSLDALEDALRDFTIARRTAEAPGPDGWALGGSSLMVPFRPDVNGFAQVDIVERPWPDGMGSPKGPEAALFGAWALGNFGPSTFPGSLERALTHSYRWPEAEEIVPNHRAFLRVRTSYVFGAPKNAPVLPQDYDALKELLFVTDLALAASALENTLAFFNPNGEVLTAPDEVRALRERHLSGGPAPLEAWANVRMFRIADVGSEPWILFDTVGFDQLDLQDHEGALPAALPDIDLVPGLLYSSANYDLSKGGVLSVNDTSTDLAGRNWRARAEGDALIQPPRQVLRWSLEAVVPPKKLLLGP